MKKVFCISVAFGYAPQAAVLEMVCNTGVKGNHTASAARTMES